MAIDSPATYSDYYWKNSVEASEAFDESIEKALSPFLADIIGEIPDKEQLPLGIQSLLSQISSPQSPAWGGVGLRFASEIADGIVGSALAPATRIARQAAEYNILSNIVSPQQASLLSRRKKITPELFDSYMKYGGYPELEYRFLHQSFEPYPTIPDLILYSRYHGAPDNVWSTLQEFYDIDPVDFKLWDWMGLQRLTTLQVQTLYRRGLINESTLSNNLAEIGWSASDRTLVQELGWTIPNAMLLVQGDLLQGRGEQDIINDISVADINPKYAGQYLDAILTKPASQDIIAYELRRDPDLSELPARLRKIGIHPDYAPLYRELAYQIPPVADIITMAVREAFTPAIAAKFGQYQDFPEPLETWAAKKGLSSDWAKRYWAAHWSLPSPLQGFEMLHRGVINRGELDMLLRALDVMPFWREKLTGIAYRRVTRVDIRRMYKSGIISVKDVFQANLELGYTERDAQRMTDFTVQWALPKEASITRSDILTAYKTRMITRTEASELLEDMGEEYFHREFMLKAVDYKKGLELTELQIKGISNLYKRRVYDKDKASDELLKLDLPAEEVNTLMQQWYYEMKASIPRHWTTSQTLGFIKEGLITSERGREELSNIGYDTEHIEVYMRTIE